MSDTTLARAELANRIETLDMQISHEQGNRVRMLRELVRNRRSLTYLMTVRSQYQIVLDEATP